MKKILLVAPQSNDTVLGVIGRYCADSLKGLGFEIEIFDFRKSQYLKGKVGSVVRSGIKKFFPGLPAKLSLVGFLETQKMNQALLSKVKEFRPDILFVLMGDKILGPTLESIKKTGAITVNWFHDTVLAPIRRTLVASVSAYYDYFFMIDSLQVLNYVKISSKHVFNMPLACCPEVHKKIDLNEEDLKKYSSQVSFIGTLKFGREQVLTNLRDFDLGIWGYWSKKSRQLKDCYRDKYIYAQDAAKICNATKVAIDIPVAYGSQSTIFYVTPRVFEIPACGTFLLTQETAYLKDLYRIGEEIICYRDGEDLKEKVDYFLKHPQEREIIANKARLRAYRDHTYEKRMSSIISIIEKNEN
jgi:spore maturation protein CgeB